MIPESSGSISAALGDADEMRPPGGAEPRPNGSGVESAEARPDGSGVESAEARPNGSGVESAEPRPDGSGVARVAAAPGALARLDWLARSAISFSDGRFFSGGREAVPLEGLAPGLPATTLAAACDGVP